MQSYYTASSSISISIEHFPPGFECAETSQPLSEVQAKENENKPIWRKQKSTFSHLPSFLLAREN